MEMKQRRLTVALAERFSVLSLSNLFNLYVVRYCIVPSKRYENAEQEFVAAKLDLHNCKELKEGLQEHLFTIIKLNETKKSEKLSELHNRLENLGLE